MALDVQQDPFDRTPSLSLSESTSNSGEFALSLPQTPEKFSILPPLADQDKDKPLVQHRPSLAFSNTSNRRSRALSSFFHLETPPAALVASIKHPRILAYLLQHIDWLDFFALSQTCRDIRQLLHLPALRDITLAHFIPGYRFALYNRVPHRFQDVPVSFHDLNVFLISHDVHLHRYPMHALAVLSSPIPSLEDDEMTVKLTTFALAHSRFVLLLQSLVHSSESPIPFEPFDHGRSQLSQSGARELIFPAPLAYAQIINVGVVPHIKSAVNRPVTSPGLLSKPNPLRLPDSPPKPPGYTKGVRRRRLSIFGAADLVLPPPPTLQPRALLEYSNSWRRSSRHPRSASVDDLSVPLSHHSKFASSTLPNNWLFTASSLPRNSIVRNPSPPLPNPTTFWSSSPHDLLMATSRNRAPILRVFVPCSDLAESITECEDQLLEAGLWEHLSTGDIICNLGFVPPTSSDGSDDVNEFGAEKDARQSGRRTWLVFNGYALVQFTPPDPPPFEEPLTLPSPFYYAHLLPPLLNPLYVFRVPACNDVPHLTLTHSVTTVPSPHSPNGHAVVKRYMWIARVSRRGPEEGLGAGWEGEWILEVEGTKEGRAVLLDCLKGCEVQREWELVREKSGDGRVWLKLLRSFYPPGHTKNQGVRHMPPFDSGLLSRLKKI